MSGYKELRSGSLERIGGLVARSSVLAGVLVAASCSGGSSNMGMSPPIGTGQMVAGRIMGGQQPVNGSAVTAYVPGTGGLGQAGTVLVGPVMTDANGGFTFASGSYTCPANDPPVYLVAVGGDAGSGSNSALALSAGVAQCSQLATTFVNIDEVTTVASVWSLSQFLDSTGVQLSTTSSAVGQTGVTNAALTIANLADVTTGQAATSLVAGASGSSPGATVNTLANLLSHCVNSDGSSTSPCAQLFSLATPSGGTAPNTTLAAAWSIARNPANNVSTLFMTTQSTDPFQVPQPLTAAPDDWTLVIQFTGGALDASSSPTGLAIDAAGDVWVSSDTSDSTVNGGAGFVLPISPQGAQGPTVLDGGIFNPGVMAFDALGQLWVADGHTPATVNAGSGSVTGLSISGASITAVQGSPFTGDPANPFLSPSAIGVDSANSIWVADRNSVGDGSGSVTILASASAYAGTRTLFSAPAGAEVLYASIAFDATGNAWLGDGDNASILELTDSNLASQVYFRATTYVTAPVTAVAVDPSGNVWAPGQSSGTGVTELMNKGANTYTGINYPGIPGTAIPSPGALAIDGAGKPWYDVRSLTSAGLAGCLVALDPTSGNDLSGTSNGAIGCLGGSVFSGQPAGALAIDPSGNIWRANETGTKVFEVVGVAVPVTTPLVGFAKPL